MQVLESKTLDELKDRLLEASSRLKDLDIFSYIDVECDAGPEVNARANCHLSRRNISSPDAHVRLQVPIPCSQ